MITLAVTAAALLTAALMLLAQPPDPPASRSIQCPARAARRLPCGSQARKPEPAAVCRTARGQRTPARVLSAAADALATADLVLLTQWACAPATPRPARRHPVGGRP
jgi:hypothetical protein